MDLAKGKFYRTKPSVRQDPEAVVNLKIGWSKLGCVIEIILILS